MYAVSWIVRVVVRSWPNTTSDNELTSFSSFVFRWILLFGPIHYQMTSSHLFLLLCSGEFFYLAQYIIRWRAHIFFFFCVPVNSFIWPNTLSDDELTSFSSFVFRWILLFGPIHYQMTSSHLFLLLCSGEFFYLAQYIIRWRAHIFFFFCDPVSSLAHNIGQNEIFLMCSSEFFSSQNWPKNQTVDNLNSQNLPFSTSETSE